MAHLEKDFVFSVSDSSVFYVEMAGRTSRKRNAPARLREGKKILMFVCLRKLQKLEVSFVLELRS